MIAALTFLAAIAAEPSYEPVVATIAEVRARPQDYDGQLIRVRGWINSCKPLSCWIAERKSAVSGGAGQHLSIASNDFFDTVVRSQTPVHVVIDAAFSSECLTNEICLDRAPELTIVRAALDPTGDTLPTRD